jgi:Protein of unknown function (DUF3037)
LNSKKIFYSVCRYVPDILRDEFINIGVLTYIPKLGKSNFHKTKNLARVKYFDDEVEMDILKALLESLEIQFNLSHPPTSNETDDFLKRELVYYVNQVQFSEIRALNSNNITEDINDLYDMYLYYDKKKSERINSDRVRRLVSKLFKQNDYRDIDRDPLPQNEFNQKPFDFSVYIKGECTYIKALSFDYKNENRLYNEIKSLLYDLRFFKEKDIDNIKIVINNTNIETEFEKLAFNLLSKETEVLTLQQFADQVNFNENHEQQLKLFN